MPYQPPKPSSGEKEVRVAIDRVCNGSSRSGPRTASLLANHHQISIQLDLIATFPWIEGVFCLKLLSQPIPLMY